MYVRREINGRIVRLFKGQRARAFLLSNHGHLRVVVRVNHGDEGKPTRKFYPVEEAEQANAYAKEQEGAALEDGTIVREADKLAVRLYRAWENEERAAGRSVPSLAAIVQAAAKLTEQRRNAATLAQAIADYLEEGRQRLKPSRLRLVESALRRFGQKMPTRYQCDDITEKHVSSALSAMLDKDAKDSTRQQYLAILSSVFARAIERGRATRNPAAMVAKTSRKPEQGEITFLPVAKAAVLVRVAAQHPKYAMALLIGLLTGIRAAERCRLTWGDIRLNEKQPHIYLSAPRAKNASARIVKLYGSHADILRAVMPQRFDPAAPVIGEHDGVRGAEYALFGAQAQIAETAGIACPRNIFRHTAATYLTAYLESTGEAALNMGHTESMLRSTYRGLVTHSEAVKFFSMPVPEAIQPYRVASFKPRKKAAARRKARRRRSA